MRARSVEQQQHELPCARGGGECACVVCFTVSELLRHRHTVEQYGVRVDIPTEAHRVYHSSTCSILTRYSWPCFESNGFLFGRRYAE